MGMQITLDTETLKNRLELVGRVSTKHVTLPVLQCVLIEAEGSNCVIKATNLEIGLEARLDAQVSEPGMVAVPATTLMQTVALISHKEITLKAEEGVLVVEGSGSETSIKSIPHDEFPTIPRIEGDGQTVNNKLFSLGIKTASFAASQSSIKPELGSVYIFQKKEHSLTFVATDSFRLMEKTVPQKGVILDGSVLIPQKNAVEIARVCDLCESDPVFRVNENQCSLEFEDSVHITSRLTSGSFPDYVQIIPKEYASHTTLLKQDLVLALKKTNIFLNKFFQVGIHITKDSLTVNANSGEVGTTTESITAATEGEELTLNFNQRYIVEPLSHIADESIVMHFAGIGRPMVVEGVNDKTLRYLVMPMNK